MKSAAADVANKAADLGASAMKVVTDLVT